CPFSVDYFRCGKCSKEFVLLEEFVLHKLFVENCSLILWESSKIQGMKLPKFLEKPVKHEFGNRFKEITSKKQNIQESTTLCVSANNTNNDFDLKLTDLLTFKQNDKSTQANERNFEELHCSLKDQQVGTLEEKSNDNSSDKKTVVLKTHISTVHNDVRPYPCHHCSQTFKTKGSLVRHIRRHTDERPFHCNQCGRSFRESGALTRHLKSRIPCLTKADTDLPRYGKTMVLEDSECEIIITKVSEDDCNLKPNDKRKQVCAQVVVSINNNNDENT
ncbi:hypothetical protein C0J52_09462, partial [Blattella germanica]